jgi:hypothetical protein
MGWVVVAGAAAVAAAVAAVGRRRRAHRQRLLMHLCHEAGLSFMPLDPFPHTTWLPFRLFGRGTARGAENVVWHRGDADGSVRAFDYWFKEERGQAGGDPVHRFTCAVAELPFACPRLEVIPHGPLELFPGALGDDIDLELEEFNRRFRISAEDRRFAVAFLDPRMMAAMMRLPEGIALAVNQAHLLLWAPQLPAPQLLMVLEVARTLARRAPTVVASLYPPGPSEAPFERRWRQGGWSPDPIGAD